jgi:hypothetical protein
MLDGADLSGALLDDADLTGASLRGARLGGANLLRARLANANLSLVNLSTAVLRDDSYADCPLLTGANLESSSLAGQWIRGDFSEVSLEGADLTGTELHGPLTRARFRGANLTGARLFSDFLETSFTGTDLSTIRQITVKGSRIDPPPLRWNRTTRWPPGLAGYLLAYRLMTLEELHPGWIVLFSVSLPLALATHGALTSKLVIAFWIVLLSLCAAALRVVAVRHRKTDWQTGHF